jgi:hypothetical protein
MDKTEYYEWLIERLEQQVIQQKERIREVLSRVEELQQQRDHLLHEREEEAKIRENSFWRRIGGW